LRPDRLGWGTAILRWSEGKLFRQLESWLRRYGLAIACLILPLVPPNLASSLLMPERIENIKFSYILLSSKSDQDKKAGDDSARSAERAVDGRIKLDPLFTRHLAGRNPLALTSKYSYVIDAAILVFAAVAPMSSAGQAAPSPAMASDSRYQFFVEFRPKLAHSPSLHF
jgi:hypothetical protein